jgi:hypothetical protein
MVKMIIWIGAFVVLPLTLDLFGLSYPLEASSLGAVGHVSTGGPPAGAGQAASQKPSSTEMMLAAKTVFVMAFGPTEERKTPGLIGERLAAASLAQRTLEKAVREWRRFVIVDDAANADLVFVVVEWNEETKWGKNLQCHDRLLVYQGHATPAKDSTPLWQLEDGQWGGCSAAARPLKALRKELEKAEKSGR